MISEKRKAYLKILSIERYDLEKWGAFLEIKKDLSEEEIKFMDEEYRNYFFSSFRGQRNKGGRCVDAFQYKNECGGYKPPERKIII